MPFKKSPDELNWDVLVALGWSIKPVDAFHGRKFFSIFDPTGSIRATDEGDPYAAAKRLGNIPLFAMSETMAIKLLDSRPFVIQHVHITTSQGIERYVYHVSLPDSPNVHVDENLAVAICNCFLKDVVKS